MIPDILEKIEEVKKIYLEKHAEGIRDKDIFQIHLTAYFEPKLPSSDWMFFINKTRLWRRVEIEAEETARALREEMMTEDEAIEMQQSNRRRTILLLKRLLNRYESNPKFYINITVKEISMLYKIIQSAEDAMEKTELAKSKLKLDVVKTFFMPYQKYLPEELKLLKEQINGAFQRIEESGGVGQISSGAGGN